MSPKSPSESADTKPGNIIEGLEQGTTFTIDPIQSVMARNVELKVPQPTNGENNRTVYKFSNGVAELTSGTIFTLVEPSTIVFGAASPVSAEEAHSGAIVQTGDTLLFIENTIFSKFGIELVR